MKMNIPSKDEVEEEERKAGSWRRRHPEYFGEESKKRAIQDNSSDFIQMAIKKGFTHEDVNLFMDYYYQNGRSFNWNLNKLKKVI